MKEILREEIQALTEALGQEVGSLDVLLERAALEITQLKKQVAALNGSKHREHIGNICGVGKFPTIPVGAEVFAEWE